MLQGRFLTWNSCDHQECPVKNQYFEGVTAFVSEKAMAPHSITLARKIPWTEEPGRLQTMGLQTVGHDRATSLSADGGGEAHPCGAFLRPLSMGCTPFPVSFCARDLATWPHTDCTGLGNDHPGQQPPQLSPSPAVNHLVSTLQVLFPLLLFSC